jgi:hypothetical protein
MYITVSSCKRMGGGGRKGGSRGKEEEMTQTLYAHMNKRCIKQTTELE